MNNNTPCFLYVFKISKPICILFKWKTFNPFCNVCREGQARSLPPVVEVLRDTSGSELTSLTHRSRLSGL